MNVLIWFSRTEGPRVLGIYTSYLAANNEKIRLLEDKDNDPSFYRTGTFYISGSYFCRDENGQVVNNLVIC